MQIDLVSTGATLEANGLREVEVIYRSKACLIQRDGEMEESKQQLIDKLLTRIQGVINLSCGASLPLWHITSS